MRVIPKIHEHLPLILRGIPESKSSSIPRIRNKNINNAVLIIMTTIAFKRFFIKIPALHYQLQFLSLSLPLSLHHHWEKLSSFHFLLFCFYYPRMWISNGASAVIVDRSGYKYNSGEKSHGRQQKMMEQQQHRNHNGTGALFSIHHL